MRDWEELRIIFRRECARRSVRATAEAIGYSREGIYKILRGQVRQPLEPVIRWAERVAQQQDKE